MNKFIIISAYTDNFKEIADISYQTYEKYCKKQDMSFSIFKLINIERPASWYKIPLILDRFKEGYEYVMWVDADTLVINNDFKLNDIINNKYEIYICEDMNGFNCGVMIWKNSELTKSILNTIWNMENFINHSWWEQAAFIELYNKDPSVQDIVCQVPQNIMNAYDYSLYNIDNHTGQVNKQSFIFHLPGIENSSRIKIMKNTLFEKN